MALYTLVSKVSQKHIICTLLVKAAPNLPRFKGREHKPCLLRNEVSKNFQSYFKTATPSTKIMLSLALGYISKRTMVIAVLLLVDWFWTMKLEVKASGGYWIICYTLPIQMIISSRNVLIGTQRNNV